MDSGRDMPELVVFDILIFLPVVSLLRFKTVCKLWCSIIESSSFIRQHLNHNNEKNNLIVRSLGNKLSILSGRKHELCVNLNLEDIDPDFNILGSCNGILLGHGYSGKRWRKRWRLSLCNPATKQVRKLPELPYFTPGRMTLSNGCALHFDIKADDYNIVSVSVDTHGGPLNHGLVQVYSMRTDSWRTIHEGCDFPIMYINNVGVACKNGICLWRGYPSAERIMVILYFDLTKEAYGTIALPDDHKGGPAFSLSFVRDKVTYMEWNCETRCCYYEIWRMNEFGIKESWNKLYKLKDAIIPGRVPVLLHLSKDGDFFFVHKMGHDVYDELYMYYFATAELKKLDVQNAFRIQNYIESMVSIESAAETS